VVVHHTSLCSFNFSESFLDIFERLLDVEVVLMLLVELCELVGRRSGRDAELSETGRGVGTAMCECEKTSATVEMKSDVRGIFQYVFAGKYKEAEERLEM